MGPLFSMVLSNHSSSLLHQAFIFLTSRSWRKPAKYPLQVLKGDLDTTLYQKKRILNKFIFCPSVPVCAILCLESRVYHRFHFHSKHAFSFCYTSTPKSAKIYNVFNAGLCPPSTIYIASSNHRLHSQNPIPSNPIRILEAPGHHAIPLRGAQSLPQENGILWR